MANEKHDPWALLREAREVALGVMRAANHVSYTQWTPEMHRASIVLRDIDAALAEHDAVPPSEEKMDSATPVVEWRADGFGRAAMVGNASLSVWSWKDGWAWSCERHGETTGVAKNEEAAKSAAIAAARGMK